MRALRFIAAEAWHEFRAAFRGTFIPIAFPALVGYVLLVVLNADYMRDMGGTDVPRNSPHLVYLMTSGQAVWLLFAWAWLFAQAVVRDRSARLHEVVLSAPVSLPGLLAGRYLGALAAALLLIAAAGVGFLLVPVLGVVGLLPPEAVGPAPVFAIGHALLILGLPSAAGVGALFLCAAIRTRGLAGPFALAAVLMLVWMVSMVVLRGGDANVTLASYIDPTGFAEVEEQAVHTWTPREKVVGVLELTPPLIANRVVWSLPARSCWRWSCGASGASGWPWSRPPRQGSGTAPRTIPRPNPRPPPPRSVPPGRRPGAGPPGTRRRGTWASRFAAGASRSRSCCSRWRGWQEPSSTSSCTPTARSWPDPI